MSRHTHHYVAIGREVALRIPRPQAVSYGRHALHAGFKHCSHSAAVMEADAGVVTMVDARHHKVRLAGNHLLQRKLHAVDGRSATRIDGEPLERVVEEAYPDRHERRNGTGRTRPGRVRGNHDDIAQRAHHLGQLTNPPGMDTIIVGNKYKRSV